MSLGLLLLAAGASRRFGTDDKLLAPLAGRPLVQHAINLVMRIEGTHRVAVVSSEQVAILAREAGMEVVSVRRGQPQSQSLRAGLARLRLRDLTRVLVTLGDMPFLRIEDLEAVLARPADRPACAAVGAVPMPPAAFPRSWLDRLAEVEGDRGAGAVLRALPRSSWVDLPPEHLRDVDVPEDLLPSISR